MRLWCAVAPLALFIGMCTAFDNTCILRDAALTPPTRNAPQTWLSECPGWVVNTTDAVWNTRTDVNASLEKYFYQNWTSNSAWGASKHGMAALKELVASTVTAFPDIRININDVFCYGNDVDGYKTVMPDLVTGTNLGPSSYGPPTGKKVAYGGIAVCYVQKVGGQWQYISEWLLHDEWAMLGQMGIEDLSKVPHPPLQYSTHDCHVNTPGFGWHAPGEAPIKLQPQHQPDTPSSPIIASSATTSSTEAAAAAAVEQLEQDMPTGKAVVKAMDATISAHTVWNNWTEWSAMEAPFWDPDMIYDTVYTPDPNVLGNSSGLREWYNNEHIPFNLAFSNCTFNQMIFAGETSSATTTTYGNALWRGDFGTIPHTSKMATIRICDFYRIDPPRIQYNWMMLDMVDLMLQAGYRVLPKPALREQWVLPPAAMDGIPAPLSAIVDPAHTQAARSLVQAALQSEWQEGNLTGALWAADMTWYGPVGFGVAHGVQEYLTHFLKPLHAAFTDQELQVDVVSCEGKFCGAHGYLHGTHSAEWLGEKATGKRVALRFGMHWHVDVDAMKLQEGYAMFDLPAVFQQMGVDLYGRMRQMQ